MRIPPACNNDVFLYDRQHPSYKALDERLRKAQVGGGEQRIAKQHQSGKVSENQGKQCSPNAC